MKLTINLNDPNERANAIAVIGLWDEEAAQEPVAEEVTYLPEDAPEVEHLEEKLADAVPAEVVEPEPEEAKAPTEMPKAAIPGKVEAPADKTLPAVSLVDAQTLAKRLVREKGYDKDGIVALFAPAESISTLSDYDRAAFAAKCSDILGEANV